MNQDGSALPRTMEVLRRGVESGLHIGAQGFVSQNGKTVADFAIGESRPTLEMSRDAVMLWLSACKPIAAVAIAQLMEKDRLDLDHPVARYIPEFGANGKEAVTIRHILTHTCGFRWAHTGWPADSWEQIIANLCDAPLERDWTPGQKAGYHPNTSWFILGEIIHRIDGRLYEQYVRDEIFLPLEMTDAWIGMSSSRYRAYGSRLCPLQQTDHQPIRTLPPWDREESFTHCRPAANGCGPARQLARFYQMLLGKGFLDGVRVLSDDSVRLLTSRQRVGMFDLSFQHIIDWGLGFIVNSERNAPGRIPYGFGPFASDDAFGHNGFQSTSAFADPAHGLVVVITPNGTPGDAAHERRLREMLAAVYEDLGLAR